LAFGAPEFPRREHRGRFRESLRCEHPSDPRLTPAMALFVCLFVCLCPKPEFRSKKVNFAENQRLYAESRCEKSSSNIDDNEKS